MPPEHRRAVQVPLKPAFPGPVTKDGGFRSDVIRRGREADDQPAVTDGRFGRT